MPVRDIAEAVCRNIGGRVVSVPWPKDREVIEIGDAVISNERIRAALGWSPQWTWTPASRGRASTSRRRLKHYLG
jgi:nucleoside-diphosphate-sugar epimerase